MEYYCHTCQEWLDSAYCESHFDGVHGQKDMTFEHLQTRYEQVGAFMTRPTPSDEATDEKKIFLTNNFQHRF